MHPILFRLGPITVYSFGVMLALGVFLVAWSAARMMARWRQRPVTDAPTDAQVYDLVLWMLVAGLVGGRAFFVALNWRDYLSRPWEIAALWHGGLVYYGSLAGGWGAMVWYLRRRRLPILRTIDFLAPFIPIGQAVGRVGCFLNGCCYGKPAAWLGVRLPGHPEPLHPVQLYESVGCLILFAALLTLQRTAWRAKLSDPSGWAGRWTHPGMITALYLVGYSLLRFALEFWRGDNPVVWLGLTLPQLMSIVIVFLAGGWLVWRVRTS
ncbi:MAG: prolipoprotein diacylglyceryl transferase [Candidatus Omnitrophica bacterium]|nr:prolipoprotein diacylglyceryl transferase [Candidatus Omnitrophota bacterium]